MKKYFEDKYPQLLALAPVSALSARGGVEWKIGVKMTADRKEQMKGLMEDYIDNYAKFIPSIKLLEQHKVFGDEHADDDVGVSWGWNLIMAQSDKTVVKSREAAVSKNPTVSYVKTGSGFQLNTGPSKRPPRKSALFR